MVTGSHETQFRNFCFPVVEALPFLGSICDSLARPFTPRPPETLGNPSERECPAHDTAAENTVLKITKCTASFITKQKIVYDHDLFHFTAKAAASPYRGILTSLFTQLLKQ